MIEHFDSYLRALRQTPLDEHTEMTGRSALEALLNAFALRAAGGAFTIQHEPKHVANKGAPDFKVSQRGMIVGYVETKAFGENLDRILKSDQIKKYRTLSQNILLTDYLHFIWITANGVQRETLCFPTDLESSKFQPRQDKVEAVARLLDGFFSTPPQGVARAKALAEALAARSRLLRDYLGDELMRQQRDHQEARLFGLFQIFRDQVFHDLTMKEFADAFAQMLAYGLFLARLNADSDAITLHNAREYVPSSFRLIRELVDFLAELERSEYRDVRWVVEEVLSIVNGLDLPSIHDDLSFRRRKAISRKVRAKDEEEHRLFERDPFIYFYEDYLRAYDKETSKARGVYYTPPPIVNFIVRAVDDVLKQSFGIHDGLADHKRVTVLDFACGTGTFLLEVFERIFDNIGGSDAGRADPIVREHILKNVFGFEYLIAPYTIAHLKLSQYLKDKGHPLAEKERLQIFLTNTLEPVAPQANLLLPAVTAEVQAAQRVKEQPILVITGNPPYSGHSKNKGEWITGAIDGYKYTIERNASGQDERVPLGEKNPKWLNDDYVKFIRFAQLKMDAVEEGIVALITNHSWLDNPTFRGMRQSLMRSFEQIYVLDLHGSAKRKERAPDGAKDENVFDIEQGVAISLFVKRLGLPRGVWRGDLWGERLQKYAAAAESSLSAVDQAIDPAPPFYIFVQQDADLSKEYQAFWSLPEIFPINVLGFQTHRDAFAISFTRAEMEEKMRVFADPSVSDQEMHRRYGLKTNRDWSLPDSRKAARAGRATPPQIVSYRPFDDRWSEYSSLSMDYPRRELINHVAGKDNVTLLSPRGVGSDQWRHAFVAQFPANDCVISNRSREANQAYPLYRYTATGERFENFSKEFRAFIDCKFSAHHTPEELLGYVYAILNAPSYRERYAGFLRIDFPRIPFPESAEDFEALATLGWQLIQAHLLHDPPRRGLADFHGKGDRAVERVRYSAEEKTVHINDAQCFKPIPEEVWTFHIGGYQVLDKYLKSRKGRVLTLDEITHVSAVADSLAFTIEHMGKIDMAYRAAFKIDDQAKSDLAS